VDHHWRSGDAAPADGFCATREEAMARFAETWRAWLALRRSTAPSGLINLAAVEKTPAEGRPMGCLEHMSRGAVDG
jgi:hypothetical protein